MSVVAILVCLVMIAIDQITKLIAFHNLKPIESIEIIQNIFSLTFVENRGAAFGLFQGGRWFFVITTIFVLVGLVIYYTKLPQGKVYNWLRVSLVMILAGAVGNFIDRLRQGYVIDFFHATFIEFPVFNVADVYLVCGTALLSVLTIFFVKDEKEADVETESIVEAEAVEDIIEKGQS